MYTVFSRGLSIIRTWFRVTARSDRLSQSAKRSRGDTQDQRESGSTSTPPLRWNPCKKWKHFFHFLHAVVLDRNFQESVNRQLCHAAPGYKATLDILVLTSLGWVKLDCCIFSGRLDDTMQAVVRCFCLSSVFLCESSSIVEVGQIAKRPPSHPASTRLSCTQVSNQFWVNYPFNKRNINWNADIGPVLAYVTVLVNSSQRGDVRPLH